MHRRFIRWRDKGIWEKLLEILIDDLDYEWLMIDARHCKVHRHAAGARGGNQDMSRTKGGSNRNGPVRVYCAPLGKVPGHRIPRIDLLDVALSFYGHSPAKT